MLNEKENVDEILSSSSEDYLKAIYLIISEKEAVRPKDIAAELKVSNASVTVALKSLAEKGMIDYERFDAIGLTPEGRKAALQIIKRHDLLKNFFENILGVDSETADNTAHIMEHDISPLVVEKLAQFSEFIEICPRAGFKWIQGHNLNCDRSVTAKNCERCVGRISRKVKIRTARVEEGKIKTFILNTLKAGQRGKIVNIFEQGLPKKKLAAKGIVLGSIVEVEKPAPIGVGFMEVKVHGQLLLFKKEDLAKIEVELLK